jgi:hypothetical protein
MHRITTTQFKCAQPTQHPAEPLGNAYQQAESEAMSSDMRNQHPIPTSSRISMTMTRATESFFNRLNDQQPQVHRYMPANEASLANEPASRDRTCTTGRPL